MQYGAGWTHHHHHGASDHPDHLDHLDHPHPYGATGDWGAMDAVVDDRAFPVGIFDIILNG